jgi:hypothetical protein
MAEQVLLFKIELCPEIRSVYINHFISRPYLPVAVHQPEIEPLPADSINPDFRNECGFQTSKSDSFADDNSTGTLLELESLQALKNTLSDFAMISGLKCNTEKTVLMPIGPRVPVSEQIRDLGFCLEEKIHILGMDIDRDLEHLDENFERTLLNLKKCVQYWSRYNLTLTGRINVIKSLLFSQILYLGNFIMPSADRLKKIQTVLDEFAVGTMNFAKNRIYLAKEEGGLGLFNVENFLIGQQAVWILRASLSTRDNWRHKLRSLCNGNVLCAGPHLIKKSANPVLHGLATSFEKFRLKHDGTHSNFAQATVFNNPIFFRGPGNKVPLDLTYLDIQEGTNHPVCSLTAKEFFDNNGLRTRLDLSITYGLDISVEAYGLLARCLNHYVVRIRPNRLNNGSIASIREEFEQLKKPGKKIRKVLARHRKKNFDIEKAKATVTFCEVSGTLFTDPESYGFRISLWGVRGLLNRTRTFFFKYFNNILGLNVRLSHFVNNQQRGCTFCTLNNLGTVPDETFSHLFYDCITTRNWQENFLREHLPENFFNNDVEKRLFFITGYNNRYPMNLLLTTAVLLFQYCIWEAKLKKKIPSFHTLNEEFLDLCRKFIWSNSVAHNCCTSNNFPLRRNLGYGGAAVNAAGHEQDGGPPQQQGHQGHARRQHRHHRLQLQRHAPRPPPAPDE